MNKELLKEYNKLAKTATDSAFKPLKTDHEFSDEVMQGRIDHLKRVVNLEKTTHLPKPFPSSPSIKPKHVLKITKPGDDMLIMLSFAATYAAVAFISAACDNKMGKLKWADHNTVHLPHDYLLSADTLEDIFEHTLSKEENAWLLPEPYSTHAKNIFEGKSVQAKLEYIDPEFKKLKEERTERIKKSRAKPTASRDGLITLATICEEVGMSPRDARMILRKKSKKTEAGWAWPDAEADTIRRLLKGDK
jgi:hypothetical protein